MLFALKRRKYSVNCYLSLRASERRLKYAKRGIFDCLFFSLTSAKQILINELKVCLFLSDKSRTTHNALKSDFEARLTYDVIEYEKVKAVFL